MKKKTGTFYDLLLKWIRSKTKTISHWFSRKRDVIERLSLYAAILIYFVSQFFLSIGPVFASQGPIEPDDAYSYIMKAAQIEAGCFSNPCPALDSLREQFLTPTQDTHSAAIRHREYHRIFYFYHPLHSFALSGLHRLGLTLENAYTTVWVVGKLVILFSVAFWTLSLWEKKVATIGMLLLAPLVFPAQGLHSVVPSNLALACGLILWAIVINKTRGRYFLMPLLVTAMVLLHPIGRVYAVLIVGFTILELRRPLERKYFAGILVSGLVLLASTIVPIFVQYPELSFNPTQFLSGNWTFLPALSAELSEIERFLFLWGIPFGGIYILIALVSIGLFAASENRRNFLVFSVLSGLSIASILYVVPFYGAILFERTWVPLALFAVTCIASAILLIGSWVREQYLRKSPQGKNQAIQSIQRAIALAIAVLGVVGILRYWVLEARNYVATYHELSERESVPFNAEQLAIISESESTTALVLYMNELPMYYFLTNGALKYQALYFPAFEGTPDQKVFTEETDKIDFLVASNPILALPHDHKGQIVLGKDELFVIRGDGPVDFGSLALYLDQRSEPIILTLTTIVGEVRDDRSATIQAGAAGWITLDVMLPSADRLVIKLRQTNAPLNIGGLRLLAEQPTMWPWNTEIALIHRGADEEEVEVLFNGLAQRLGFDLEVLNDIGYSILAKVIP